MDSELPFYVKLQHPAFRQGHSALKPMPKAPRTKIITIYWWLTGTCSPGGFVIRMMNVSRIVLKDMFNTLPGQI